MTAQDIINENIEIQEYFIARDNAEIALAKAVYSSLPLIPVNAEARVAVLYEIACEGCADGYAVNVYGENVAMFYLNEVNRRLMGTSADTVIVYEDGRSIWM